MHGLSRHDVKHAPKFAKAMLLYGDDVVGCDNFVERELTTRIGNRSLCFQSCGTEEYDGCATHTRASLVHHCSGDLSGKRRVCVRGCWKKNRQCGKCKH